MLILIFAAIVSSSRLVFTFIFNSRPAAYANENVRHFERRLGSTPTILTVDFVPQFHMLIFR